MNKTALYNKSNPLQRSDTQQALGEFGHLLEWRSDGDGSVLNAGCGAGDVTVEILLPILPPNFKSLVGVDLSNQMINHPKVQFERFDLAAEFENQPLNGIEPVDHNFSFYCLMWIHQ